MVFLILAFVLLLKTVSVCLLAPQNCTRLYDYKWCHPQERYWRWQRSWKKVKIQSFYYSEYPFRCNVIRYFSSSFSNIGIPIHFCLTNTWTYTIFRWTKLTYITLIVISSKFIHNNWHKRQRQESNPWNQMQNHCRHTPAKNILGAADDIFTSLQYLPAITTKEKYSLDFFCYTKGKDKLEQMGRCL